MAGKDLFPTSGSPDDSVAYNPKRPTSTMGAAVPANLAAPGGGIMPKPQPDGFPLPGARKVDEPNAPKAKGKRDDKVMDWSAPVPDIGDSAKRGSQPRLTKPSGGATNAFGSARIPRGGGRAR